MEKCLTSVDKRMPKRHTPRSLESMNDMDHLSHNDMREATPLLLLTVPYTVLYVPPGLQGIKPYRFKIDDKIFKMY